MTRPITMPRLRPPTPVLHALRFLRDYVSPLGWTILAATVLCAAGYAVLGWDELLATATLWAILLIVAVVMSLGNTGFSATLDVPARRITVGDTVDVEVTVSNPGRAATAHAHGDITIGDDHEGFPIPALAPRQSKQTGVTFTAASRAVLSVGPLRVRKGDPFGLIRHEKTIAERISVYIHPRTARLHTLDAGIQRDLEGQPSGDIVDDDLDFYGLREYEPGDDMRNVHWLSTAKAGTLMIRQYEATRRTTTVLALGVNPRDYASREEFELAVSIHASIGVQCLLQHRPLRTMAGGQEDAPRTSMAFLDACSAIEPDAQEKTNLAAAALDHCPDASLYCFTVGSGKHDDVVKRMMLSMPQGSARLVLRAEPGAERSLRRFDGFSLATVGDLDDLPLIMEAMA
ncbi:hypothetical protein D2E23_0597 [Bifidobacterium callimiconis]|uniref:DUF58 domain-containing protein n=2 Tax=Bifidobacterium callimiconis TaxID=2306973 RepID=A0A430FGQ0_9BIFI|nr:hypothetical protein D2E23_0597 [Bifidobacterium callimiconis]